MKPAWLRLSRERGLVLASSSPRRAELLGVAGMPFEVDPPGVEESRGGASPAVEAARLAEAKARAVAGRHPGSVVLGCDTEVVLDGEALGKPANAEEALRMLERLRGRTHEVITGIHLLDVPTGASRSALERTLVTMRDFSDAEALHYARSGDPLDKAGGYGIQSGAAVLVERIEGCYYNVVGLPLSRLATLMEELSDEIAGGRR